MEIIKSMAASGCFIGLALSAADILKPDEKFSSQIRMIFSLIFILAFTAPLIHTDFSEITEMTETLCPNPEENSICDAVQNDMIAFIEKNTAASLENTLSEKGIICTALNVKAEITENSHVIIKEVKICTENKKAAERIIKEVTGEETVVLFDEE